nr:MAG TPA: hypothetical protein [Caudoviricetes sp.]
MQSNLLSNLQSFQFACRFSRKQDNIFLKFITS